MIKVADMQAMTTLNLCVIITWSPRWVDEEARHDNAVDESFFATFKKRVTKRKIYSTREEAKTEIFNFIEMFYNPIKRHSHTGGVSPVKFEEAYYLESSSV